MVTKPLSHGSDDDFTAEGEGPGDAALSAIRAAVAEWKQQGAVQETPLSMGGIAVPTLLTPAEQHTDYMRDLGVPGAWPFTRGARPTQEREIVAPPALAGTAEQANVELRAYVAQGNTRVHVALDDATQRGLDSDAPEVLGEVAVAGVAIDSLADMAALFEGVALDAVCPSFAADAPSIVLLAFYVALADSRATPRRSLRGTVRNDVLAPFIVGAPWLLPPAASVRLARDVLSFCARALPHWQGALLGGYVVREAGATPAQEVAFALAGALTYIEACAQTGTDVEEAAAHLSFLFDVRDDFFEEVAKLRAARRLCARLLSSRLGIRRPQSLTPAMHVQTSALSLSMHQPENNAARVTLHSLAAILGGAASVHAGSLEELCALPTEPSARVGLRIQQIIDDESGASRLIDPLGGSYLIEWLTDRIERDSLALIDELDEQGGFLRAIELGWPQQKVRAEGAALQGRIERGERVVVGVNRHVSADEAPRPPAPIPINEQTQRGRIAQVAERRETRDRARVSASLDAVRLVAQQPNENLVEAIIDAAKAHCTLQEICDVLREVLGDFDGAGA